MSTTTASALDLMRESTADFVRTSDAAHALGVSEQTIRNYIRDGKVRAVRLGRMWLVDRRALLALLDH